MPRLVTYRCPECNGEFDFLHHPSDEPPPDRCQIQECQAWMGDDPPPTVPVLKISIGSAKNKVGDKVYRAMEEGSRVRAQAAAEMVGASESDMSAMKITNLKDKPYEGEHSAITTAAAAAEKQLSYSVGGHKIGPQMAGGAQLAGLREEARVGDGVGATRQMIDNINVKQTMQAAANVATNNGRMGTWNPPR